MRLASKSQKCVAAQHNTDLVAHLNLAEGMKSGADGDAPSSFDQRGGLQK